MCVVCVVWVAHISIVKTKKLRFFRIYLKKSIFWSNPPGGEGVCVCVCVGVCGCAVCGCVVCVVWVAHISIVKTKKLRFFRIFGRMPHVIWQSNF